jgi:glyoxylase-like metal-dependent hydrolase (beta-lactamase superfamily II)
MPIQESGKLKFLEESEKLTEEITVKFVYGHTEAMMLPVINYNGKTVIYCADLIPSSGHVPLPYVMAYDMQPLVTLGEKATLLKEAVQKNAILFFEHDPVTECCSLEETEKGIRVKEKFPLSAL